MKPSNLRMVGTVSAVQLKHTISPTRRVSVPADTGWKRTNIQLSLCQCQTRLIYPWSIETRPCARCISAEGLHVGL